MDPIAAKFIGSGISVIALFGVGIGLGKLFSSVIESVARNPSALKDLRSLSMTYFALLESVALLAFIVAMCLLFVV
ncbi:MAG: F0F1 ATP synthase subunit C [Holosporales bacterium]|jgi:F-type H+-transporting ATPase subunit c|nr:F0F1 ATP synthase subunit C [Holosporales bacterium]